VRQSDRLILINNGRDIVWARPVIGGNKKYYIPMEIVAFLIPDKEVVIFDIFNPTHMPQISMQGS